MVEVCTDYIGVTWQAPENDGNSPITRYIVEKADTSERNFTIAGHTDSDTLEFKVSQLNKGKQYLIRVFAENAIGRSEPLSLPHPVQLPFGECVIHVSCCVNFVMLIDVHAHTLVFIQFCVDMFTYV